MDDDGGFVDYGADLPNDLKDLVACMRCSLIKTFAQVSILERAAVAKKPAARVSHTP